MGQQFWVIGGEYADTSFSRPADGKTEERHGPWPTADAARAAWAALSMAAVDDAHTRYRIEREGGVVYWVVGGSYTGTDFTRPSPGTREERLGPFSGYDEALAVWRRRAWATVDDSFARYRIERL